MSRNTNKQKKNKKFSFGGLILIVLVTIGLYGTLFSQMAGNSTEVPKLSYIDFQKELESSNVEKVTINLDKPEFVAKLNKGVEIKVDGEINKFTEVVVPNPGKADFKEELLLADVEVNQVITEESSGGLGFLGTVLISVGVLLAAMFIFQYIAGRKGGGAQKALNEKTKAKFVGEIPKVTFDDIAGYDSVKREFDTIIDFMKNPEKYKDMGAMLPKGAILYGPPGTGKTLFAKAVAKESNVPFFAISGSDFVEMFVGVGAARVRDLFAEARKHEKAIIFIDEIDAIGKKRGVNAGGGSDEREQTLNQLLVELDGFKEASASNKSTVFIMAATNRLDVLDDALTRAGRFDKHISVPLPDKNERLSIINVYKKNKNFDKAVDFVKMAKKTWGFSGSDIKALINESAILAARQGLKVITMDNIDDAYYKTVVKGDKKPKAQREDNDDQKLIAWHEAGHGLVSKLLTNDMIVELNITPSTTGAGGMLISIPEKEGLHSREYLLQQIKVAYAGRAAEEILFGNKMQVTTGASSDIKQATNKILSYISVYGFSDDYGMLDLTNTNFKNVNVLENAKKMSNDLYQETYDLLVENKAKLEALASALLEKEVLSGDEVELLVNGTATVEDILSSTPLSNEDIEDVFGHTNNNQKGNKGLVPEVSMIEKQ